MRVVQINKQYLFSKKSLKHTQIKVKTSFIPVKDKY